MTEKLCENVRKSINEVSVYKLDVYSTMELYYILARKLNEVIHELDKLENLDEEVKNNIQEMINDGRFNDIVNNEILGDINEKLNNKIDLSGGRLTGALHTNQKIYLGGAVGEEGFITKNNAQGRNELLIYNSDKAYSQGSKGAGIHLYGNDDLKHPGAIALLTGENDEGNIRLFIDKRGRLVTGKDIIDFTDEALNHGQLTIKNPNGHPAIYITEASETEGEIAVAPHEIFRLGCYDESSGFESWLRVSKNVIRFRDNDIGVMNKNIQVGKANVKPIPNVKTTHHVTFPVPFSKPPIVTSNPVTSVAGTSLTNFGIYNISESGFDISFTRTNDTETSVNWIAIMSQ